MCREKAENGALEQSDMVIYIFRLLGPTLNLGDNG
jgi:hypothetical protein